MTLNNSCDINERINTADAARNGQKRTSNEIGRAVEVAPRTELSTA